MIKPNLLLQFEIVALELAPKHVEMRQRMVVPEDYNVEGANAANRGHVICFLRVAMNELRQRRYSNVRVIDCQPRRWPAARR